MQVVVVTRLRLKDPKYFDEFVSAAVAVVEQARNSDGNLGADVLAEASNTFWTRTVWWDRTLMNAFVGDEPHLCTMNRVDQWCDEATFVDWEQVGDDLPDWRDGYLRLLAMGRPADLTSPSAAHTSLNFPPVSS